MAEPKQLGEAARERMRALFAHLYLVRELAARLDALRRRRAVLFFVLLVPVLACGLPAALLTYHLYFDRDALPDLEAFLRFEPPTTGSVRDSRGQVLIELAREYRRVVDFDEVPLVLRQAIFAAEDKNFLDHDGVDYGVLPRVVQKTVVRSVAEWKGGQALRLLLPQGGSTLTQQLVRVYFLQELTRRRDDDPVFLVGWAPPRLLAQLLGAPAANKLLRKMEEVRLTFWLEEAMVGKYGSKLAAKQEIFARYASFIYLGDGRYGFAAACKYYFDRELASLTADDAAIAATLAAIGKSPQEYRPSRENSRLRDRRDQILELMVKNGYIAQDFAGRGRNERLAPVAASPIKTDAPAVIDHVLEELRRIGAPAGASDGFGIEDLFSGRITIFATVDGRLQTIVNDALENGLARYEKRHPQTIGQLQGSVVVLANLDAAILAEAGGRRTYQQRSSRYSDYNRVTSSLRQPGSAMKPVVYLAAFEKGLGLDTLVPDSPIFISMGEGVEAKEIANYDHLYKGPIPIRQALAESRNTVAVYLARRIGVGRVLRAAQGLGIRSPLQPNLSTALGASEVKLLELANAYRAIASGLLAEPHVIAQVTNLAGLSLYEAPVTARSIDSPALSLLREGLRGVVRLPHGTAHSLDRRDFPIAVMGKTGTTSDFRDALFVGSTYGPRGITVAVRLGFDDNRPLGDAETGAKAALPIFREILLRTYAEGLVGTAPPFPRQLEQGIDLYLAALAAPPAPAPAAELAVAAVPAAGPAIAAGAGQ